MAQRRSLAWTELRVGILVIVSFVLLAVAIFYIGGESGIFTKKYNLVIYFENANGLRSGAEVWLEGVTIGNVSSVRISRQVDPNKAVEAELRLDERYKPIIRSDSKVTIGTIGLLGDKNVDITRGTEAGTVVEEGGTLQGTEEGDIRKIVQGTNDFIANLQVLGDQVKRLAERVDRGEGTLSKFLTDTSIFDNANLATQEMRALVRDARTGNGTVGRLISDDEMYRRINTMVDRVDTLVAQIQSGHGTMGRFVNDPSVYNRVDSALGKFQTIGDRIERGEGTLGKLSKDDAVYNDFRETVARFSTLVNSIENGQGTMGKLIQDPTLYNTLSQTSSEALKLMYDFRQNPKKFLTINFKLF